MSTHQATVRWQLGSRDFRYESYSRAHTWSFDSGIEIPASAAPQFLGDDDRVDPEEAFVAAVSSCHMLTFLAIAARRRLVVESYEDGAVGHMEKIEGGKMAITRIELRPRIAFAGQAPSPQALDKLHALSHEQCFIANSVRTEIVVVKDET